jgi:hypothetical protein
MTGPLGDPPERLLAGEATDFERRVLHAALQKKPPSAASARMARALGISAVAVGGVTAAKVLAAEAVASKVTAATGTAVFWPWVSAGVLGIVIAGAVVGTRARDEAPQTAPPIAPALVAPSAPVREPVPPAHTAVGRADTAPAAASRQNRAATPPGDLGEQIAFIDSARAAVSAGANTRALEILRNYQNKYATGSFRPEATALKVEALMKLGREAEARALAERFVSEHRGSLLAARVAQIVGLENP